MTRFVLVKHFGLNLLKTNTLNRKQVKVTFEGLRTSSPHLAVFTETRWTDLIWLLLLSSSQTRESPAATLKKAAAAAALGG